MFNLSEIGLPKKSSRSIYNNVGMDEGLSKHKRNFTILSDDKKKNLDLNQLEKSVDHNRSVQQLLPQNNGKF